MIIAAREVNVPAKEDAGDTLQPPCWTNRDKDLACMELCGSSLSIVRREGQKVNR
jgi:hypothetical protein